MSNPRVEAHARERVDEALQRVHDLKIKMTWLSENKEREAREHLRVVESTLHYIRDEILEKPTDNGDVPRAGAIRRQIVTVLSTLDQPCSTRELLVGVRSEIVTANPVEVLAQLDTLTAEGQILFVSEGRFELSALGRRLASS